ncbi:MAG TPA: MarR family transcriptional regulator [Devosia sp.]|nr:MarR family transcriptional regulator [Devosia sp.]
MAKQESIAEFLAQAETAPPEIYAHGRILYIIHELSRLIATNFDKAMARHKLTHAQWWAIMHIFENPGASQSEIAGIMQMTRAAAGKLLERMEAKGWIERRSDPKDNRVRRIYLADGAVPVFRQMGEEGGFLFHALLGTLDTQTALNLLEGLRQIRHNAQVNLAK